MFKFKIGPIMLFIVSVFFIGLASRYNKATELIYTNVINRFFREKLSLIFDKISVPVGDIVTVVIIIFILLAIINFIKNIVRPKKWITYIYRLFWGSVNVICVSMFIYVLLAGLNYHIPDLSTSLIEKYNHKYSTEVKVNADNAKRVEVYKYIESKAVETKELLNTNSDAGDSDNSSWDIRDISAQISQGYSIISDQFPILGGHYCLPKYSIKSPVFNIMGLDARYYMLTNEVSVSNELPSLYQPFILGKYMAYQRGVVKEDEAEFYSYLALINSPDQKLRYSAYISMLESLSEGLKVTDKIEYNRLMSSQNHAIKKDIEIIRAYKASYGMGKDFKDLYNYTFRRVNGDVRVEPVNSQVAYILATYYSLSPYQN